MINDFKMSAYIKLLIKTLTRYDSNSNFGEHIPVDEIITRTGFEFGVKYRVAKLLNRFLSKKNLSLTTYLSPEKLYVDRI